MNIDDKFNAPRRTQVVVLTREDILQSLKWGEPEEVPTKIGPRIRTSAPATNACHELWKKDGEALRADGYTLGRWPKDTGPWRVTKWERVPERIVVQRTATADASRATDAMVNVPLPEGMTLWGYQRAGVAFMYDRRKVLLADEPGLGKTIQVIALVNCLPEVKKILVICPASLKENWKREIEKWQTRNLPTFIAGSKLLPDMVGWVIVNYDVLSKHTDILHKVQYDMLVCDECHMLKNNKTAKRSKIVLGYYPTKREREEGAKETPPILAYRKIFMTGTPILNRPAELFPLISCLDTASWPNFFKFGLRYCGGNRNGGHWDFTGASNLYELQEKLRGTIMIRRLKKDVLTDLPPKVRRIVEFDADGEAKIALAEERAQFATEDDYRRAVERLAVEAPKFGERSTFRKRMGVAKAKMASVLEYLDQAVEESEKVLIFIWHKEVCEVLRQHFAGCSVQIVGDTPVAERMQIVDRFQTDKRVKVFIGSRAAYEGITLTAASRVIFMELADVPGWNTQAEDRAHRIGQKDSVLVEHMILRGSLDAVIAKNCVAKQQIAEQALDVREKPALDSLTPDDQKPSREPDQGQLQL